MAPRKRTRTRSAPGPNTTGSPTRLPAYCLHRRSGQAYVKLGKRQVYLGAHGSPESRTAFARAVAEWLAAGRRRPDERDDGYAIGDLCADYLVHCRVYYRKPDGTPTSTLRDVVASLRELLDLYRDRPVREFGLTELKTVRHRMIHTTGLARVTVNDRIGRVVAMFGWGADEERVPPEVYGALRALKRLKRGRSEARETDPVTPVAWEHVEPVLDFVPTAVRDMIQIQWWSGCRPGEVVQLRPVDLDRTGRVWTFRPPRHKCEHHGHERVVGLGPEAQRVLLPLLDRVPRPDPHKPLFRPEAAIAETRRTMHGPNAWFRRDRKRTSPPKRRAVHESYDVYTFRRAIARGVVSANIDRVLIPALLRAWGEREPATIDDMQPTFEQITAKFALELERLDVFARIYLGPFLAIEERDAGFVRGADGRRRRRIPARLARRVLTPAGEEKARERHDVLPDWSPGQLRHAAATRLTKELGLEAARLVLGHRSPVTTLVYAEIDRRRALDVMSEHG